MASQRFSGRELAERVSSSTEVLNSYDVRLSTSATVAKKPSQKASLSVCSFFDMRQRTRFTFHKLKSRKVLHDIVVVDTQEDTTTKYALVMAKGYDFNEYVQSLTTGFAVATKRVWFSVEGYTPSEFVSAQARLCQIPLATMISPTMRPAAATSAAPAQHIPRPASAEIASVSRGDPRQQAVTQSANAPTVIQRAGTISLDDAFATAGRAKQLDDAGKHTAAVLAYEQAVREFQSVVYDADLHKLGPQHIALIRTKSQAFAKRANDIRLQLQSAQSATSAPSHNSSRAAASSPDEADLENRMLRRLAELQAKLGPRNDAAANGLQKQMNFLQRVEDLKDTAMRERELQKASNGESDPAHNDEVHSKLMQRLDRMKKSLSADIDKQRQDDAQAPAQNSSSTSSQNSAAELTMDSRVKIADEAKLHSLVLSRNDPRVGTWRPMLRSICGKEGRVTQSDFHGQEPLLVAVQIPGQPKVHLFPEAVTKCHWWDAPARSPSPLQDTAPVAKSAPAVTNASQKLDVPKKSGGISPDVATVTATRPQPPKSDAAQTGEGANIVTSSQSQHLPPQAQAQIVQKQITEPSRRTVADDRAEDTHWRRVEAVATALEDCIADTEDILRDTLGDRMKDVRVRRAAINKLFQKTSELEAVLSIPCRMPSSTSSNGQIRISAAQTLNDAHRAVAVYEVEYPPDVETVEARRSNAGKIGARAFGVTAGVVGGAAAVATAGVAVAGGLAAPRLAGVATVGTAVAGGVAAVAAGAVIGGTAAAIAAIDHAVKRDQAKQRRQKAASRVHYDWSDEDDFEDERYRDVTSSDDDDDGRY